MVDDPHDRLYPVPVSSDAPCTRVLRCTLYPCPQMLGLNEYTRMMNDLGLISKRSKLCKLADFDRTFIAVDAASARRAREQERRAHICACTCMDA